LKVRFDGFAFTFIITALILLVPAGVEAGENEDFRFAEKLYADQMYVAAAEEFTRFCDKYPASELRSRAMLKAGEAWMKAGRGKEALELFQNYIDSYPQGAEICKAWFYRGRIFSSLKMHQEAASQFLSLVERHGSCALVELALLEGGEALLSAGNPEEAARVLKRLITERRSSELVPKAWYDLHLALINMDRELEAYNTLEELARRYPDSPVSAMALLRLAQRHRGLGRFQEAGDYLDRIMDNFEEKAILEKAQFERIGILEMNNEHEALLDRAISYLSTFEESKNREAVLRMAIEASFQTGPNERSLQLIADYRSEFPEADSTGWTYLKKAEILKRAGKYAEAIQELDMMEEKFPAVALSPRILLLRADILSEESEWTEAARYYNMALVEWEEGGYKKRTAPDEEPAGRGEILLRLGGIYYSGLSDTLSAVRSWKEAARKSSGGTREKALFRAAEAKRLIGEYSEARELYSLVAGEFPQGDLGERAQDRLDLISYGKRWNEDYTSRMAEVALSGAGISERTLEAGIIYLDAFHLERAAQLINRARSGELPGEKMAQAGYYLGEAYYRKHQKKRLEGKDSGGDLKLALSTWLKTARNFNSTSWGRKAHKAYIEGNIVRWDLSTSLARLVEYRKYYREGGDRWWALEKQSSLLFEEARSGTVWAVDSAMSLCEEILSLSPPRDLKGKTVKRRAYLYRMLGENKVAARLLERYISEYGKEEADQRVFYDLGEMLIELKEYEKAAGAFAHCSGGQASGGLKRNCRLRLGDCYYLMKDYRRAEKEYFKVSKDFEDTSAGYTADYRRGLALKRMNRNAEADSTFEALLKNKEIDSGLRANLLERMGNRYMARHRLEEARDTYRQLVSVERSSENLALYADALRLTGEFEDAQGVFSEALSMEGADSCRLLAGRAGSRYRLRRYESADDDLSTLREVCPSSPKIPGVLLNKGMVLVSEDRFDEARDVLNSIAEDYPESEEAGGSLYYLALCDIESGGYEQAEEKLKRFLQEAPHSNLACMAYYKLAATQVNLAKLNLATRNFSLAFESCSGDELAFEALRNKAEIYQRMEKWEEASSTWMRIVETYPAGDGIVEILFNLGFSYAQSGKYQLAYDVYTRINALSVDEKQLGRAHYWAGICLKNMDKCPLAVREFLRVPYLRTGGMWGITSKLEAAGCYVNMEMLDEASKIYRDVIASHGKDSDWGKIAVQSLEKIQSMKTQQRNETDEKKKTG